MTAVLEERLILASDDAAKPYIQGDFFVASYQRGYRWGPLEVRQLLDDIRSRPPGRVYRLQPIVVLARPDGSWELVDGQQRLTTLKLIVKYIGTHLPSAAVGYSLTYETRPGSRDYLESLDPESASENTDFLHMQRAYEEIAAWFEDTARGAAMPLAIDMYQALSKWVQVIWYEAPAGTRPNELFARLNRDRIPLTDSELIKAQILSEGAETERGRSRQQELAAQWDGFERDLRDQQFWTFLTGSSAGRATHIDILFENLVDEPPAGQRQPFWTFDRVRARIALDGSAGRFWRDVVELMGTFTGWFEDRELYHRIGFLIAIGEPLEVLLASSRSMTHSAFRDHLKNRIGNRLDVTRDSLSMLRYNADPARCERVLLLMNVESVLRSADVESRFSFHAYAGGGWSLEHIHAQNSEQLKTDGERAVWVRVHLDEMRSVVWPDHARAEVSAVEEELTRVADSKGTIRDDAAFQRLVTRVFDVFSARDQQESEDEMHGLGNLALLQGDYNSRLNNAVFAVKRERILALDRDGAYILPCTRNVFLKYYTSAGEQQLAIWGKADSDAYYAEMLLLMAPFLMAREVALEVAP